jgi:hypothetical protein
MRITRIGLMVAMMVCWGTGHADRLDKFWRDNTLGEVMQEIQRHTARHIELDPDVASIHVGVIFHDPSFTGESADQYVRQLRIYMPVSVEETERSFRVHRISDEEFREREKKVICTGHYCYLPPDAK